MNAHPDYYYTALRVLGLTMIFLFGYLEGAVFKLPASACGTWFTGLMALTAWIVFPLTTFRICMGVIVFVSGVILMIIYYRSTKKRTGSIIKNQSKKKG
jgi:hypothetical protein